MDMIDTPDGMHDFDFLYGRWRVVNRRLVTRLQGSEAWEEFEARQWCAPLMGGIANTDEMSSPSRGVIGMSFRFFNRQTRMWSISWAAPSDGILQPPVIGRFDDGRGIFLGADVFAGQPIMVRFTWSRTATPTPRWEQEFSADAGDTWEKNWVMDFARIGDIPPGMLNPGW
jgi:hypothetical protein